MAAAAFLLLAAPVNAQPSPVRHATGSFEVTTTPESADRAGAPDRLALHKTFAGDLVGEAEGTMLAVGRPVPGQAAAYVAIDRVHGTLGGRTGGFVLLHRGTIGKSGAVDLQVTIAPDSGTGGLAGIAGGLAIEQTGGRHRYDLAYTLP